MKVAIAKEIVDGERRVAGTPETTERLVRAGCTVAVEAGAGAAASFDDEAYRQKGAEIETDPAALLASADLVARIHRPADHPAAGRHEVDLLRRDAVWVSILRPTEDVALIERMAAKGITSFALDAIPRISRAQSMDVLSSQATVAGYKAVLIAADTLGKMLPMMVTAAGTIRPAKVLVIGAGVAGLQAIATARRLGAVVKAIDTRPAAGEQVASLGAKFVPLEVTHAAEDDGGYATDLGADFYAQEQEIIAPHAAEADIIITTALIPGKPAPQLIGTAAVEAMAAGSVIVDLAAAGGGNCLLTEPGRQIEHHGVKVLGPLNLPSEVPVHASELYARNIAAFIAELTVDGMLEIDMDNEIIRESLITHNGQITHEPTRKLSGADETGQEPPPPGAATEDTE